VTFSFDDFLKVGTALVGGGALTKVLDMILSRGQMRAYAMGAVDKAVETALASVTKQLETTDYRLRVAEEHRAICERELDDVKDRQIHLQREIDRMMAGPVAPH
jgi:hypothetical protein